MFERVAGAGTQLKYENIVYSPEDRFRLQVLPSVWITRLKRRSVITAPCHCKKYGCCLPAAQQALVSLQTCSSGVINIELNIVTRNFARHHVLLS